LSELCALLTCTFSFQEKTSSLKGNTKFASSQAESIGGGDCPIPVSQKRFKMSAGPTVRCYSVCVSHNINHMMMSLPDISLCHLQTHKKIYHAEVKGAKKSDVKPKIRRRYEELFKQQ
jgi:hypothetical protein